MCYMRTDTVGVRELRQNLSVYLVRVRQGHTLIVTERGQAVAELRPLPAAGDPIAALIAEGRVRPARRSPADLPRPLRVKGDKPASEILNDLRADSI